MGIETIFIIDDDPIHQMIAKMMIDRQKIAKNIVSFLEADLALDSLRKFSGDENSLPDIILLDLNMPIMDGWDFLDEFEKIKLKLPKVIKVYIVTSSVNDKDITRAEKYSTVCGYITKPLNKDVIAKLAI